MLVKEAINGKDASIGPRSFNRGYKIKPAWNVIAHCQASIGPRSFNRGYFRPQGDPLHAGNASIGPRSFNRGYGYYASMLLCYYSTLQLGRGPSTADTHFGISLDNCILQASIGPRSFNRGYGWHCDSGVACHTGFNWAAVLQPRIPARPSRP